MEDLSTLKLRLVVAKKELAGKQAYINSLQEQIKDRSCFKAGQKIPLYIDPENCNNTRWCDCIIKKVYFKNGEYRYLVNIPSVASKYAGHYFTEEFLIDRGE